MIHLVVQTFVADRMSSLDDIVQGLVLLGYAAEKLSFEDAYERATGVRTPVALLFIFRLDRRICILCLLFTLTNFNLGGFNGYFH